MPGALLANTNTITNTITFFGNTTGASTFNESGARSFFSVPNKVYKINVSIGGVFTFTLDAIGSTNYDACLSTVLTLLTPLILQPICLRRRRSQRQHHEFRSY